ncbi:MAG TPA: hypothetical protein VMH91_03190 [Candidatus Paceibacterota bacterium]|nr:hypothetical protein [Candidatus Paceibacterota bacterium]
MKRIFRRVLRPLRIPLKLLKLFVLLVVMPLLGSVCFYARFFSHEKLTDYGYWFLPGVVLACIAFPVWSWFFGTMRNDLKIIGRFLNEKPNGKYPERSNGIVLAGLIVFSFLFLGGALELVKHNPEKMSYVFAAMLVLAGALLVLTFAHGHLRGKL